MRRARVTVLTLTILLAHVLAAAAPPRSFEAEQRTFPRVRAAFASKEPRLRALFARAGAPFPPRGILLRAFKREAVLELWAEGAGGRYVLVERYPICASSGEIGPKRREGDGQVPEGFYRLIHFNPASQFHLSLGLDYPNAYDRRAAAGGRPGGAIYIHGSCVTIGCIPITDERIEEVYVAAVLARSAGQRSIPVHVFPTALTDDALDGLAREYARAPERVAFWRDLAVGYVRFERDRRPPHVEIDQAGRYRFR
jgi:murein L,D-transpeptidase YafK